MEPPGASLGIAGGRFASGWVYAKRQTKKRPRDLCGKEGREREYPGGESLPLAWKGEDEPHTTAGGAGLTCVKDTQRSPPSGKGHVAPVR